MGKKRRMIAHPQKYGKKFAVHPALKRHLEDVDGGTEEFQFEPIVAVPEEENPAKEAPPVEKEAGEKKTSAVLSKSKSTAKAPTQK